MVKKKKKRFQGSLEYLIIIAAVLAIAAIVVLFLSGAFTGATSTGDISRCKNAAAQCATELATSAGAICSYCDAECDEYLRPACKAGEPKLIYEGAPVYFADAIGNLDVSDAGGPVKTVNMKVERVELVGNKGVQAFYETGKVVGLEDGAVIRLGERRIKPDYFTKARIFLGQELSAVDFQGNFYQGELFDGISFIEVPVNRRVRENEFLNILVDFPIAQRFEFKDQGSFAMDARNLYSSVLVTPVVPGQSQILEGIKPDQRSMSASEISELKRSIGDWNEAQKAFDFSFFVSGDTGQYRHMEFGIERITLVGLDGKEYRVLGFQRTIQFEEGGPEYVRVTARKMPFDSKGFKEIRIKLGPEFQATDWNGNQLSGFVNQGAEGLVIPIEQSPAWNPDLGAVFWLDFGNIEQKLEANAVWWFKARENDVMAAFIAVGDKNLRFEDPGKLFSHTPGPDMISGTDFNSKLLASIEPGEFQVKQFGSEWMPMSGGGTYEPVRGLVDGTSPIMHRIGNGVSERLM